MANDYFNYLIRRIQELPAELSNAILIALLELDEPDIVECIRYRHITDTYTFPPSLHISRAIRREYSPKYYKDVAFTFTSAETLRKFAIATDVEQIVTTAGFHLMLPFCLDLLDKTISLRDEINKKTTRCNRNIYIKLRQVIAGLAPLQAQFGLDRNQAFFFYRNAREYMAVVRSRWADP